MGARSYRLVRLDLNASDAPRPPLMRAMAMKDMSMESAPAPQIEAGNSQLAVNADGVIEVQMP
ncbi:hypothetical protein D3C85_1847960 [compost metagenome]